MFIRFYLLFICIYLITVSSYDDDVSDEIEHENFIKLVRVKRVGPSNTTNNSSIGPSTSTLLPPTTSPSYIISNFNATVTTTYTTILTTHTNSSASNSMTTTSQAPMSLSTTSPYNPDSCYNATYIRLPNGTCVLKDVAQVFAAVILRNNSDNVPDKINALALYISSTTNITGPKNQTDTLSVYEIDNIVDNLGGANLTINSNTSFVTVLQPDQGNNIIVLGAAYNRGIGGKVIYTTNRENITKSSLSAAAIINKEALDNVISLNMVIIDKPTMYENADNSTNKTIASSVIVATIQKNDSLPRSINITLYFTVLKEYTPNVSATYFCSFFNTNSSQWNESGCTDPQYSISYDRYECSCNHLTSFALIWLPQSLGTQNATKNFTAQDVASIVFMSISVLCFLMIIIHIICLRMIKTSMGIQTHKLLPLISTASTTILFILFIALGVTAYTQTSSSNQTQCFLSSSVLMFLVYFFLIFMFCVKTSVGYFYYLRFVHLFPQPSHQKLFIMLTVSFLISLICVSLAIGFKTKSSYNITQLYPYEFCWFTRDVVYYFMTIPVGTFLLLNIITITLVSKSIIIHARNASTSKQINERLKRCVIILLSSCVTQGIGWLFGPFISFISSSAGDILGWFFIILNGLEGVWSILLYVLIRSQQLDEQRHISAVIEISKSSGASLGKEKKLNDQIEYERNNVHDPRNDVVNRQSYSSNDLRRREINDFSSDDDDDIDTIST